MYLRWAMKCSSYLFKRFMHNGLCKSRMLIVKCGPRLLSGVCCYESCLPNCRRFYTWSRRRVGLVTPLFLQAYRFADRVALIDENRMYRYRDIMSLVELLTDRIADHLGGVNDDTAGERVCLLCPNNASHAIAQLAVWMSGSIAVAVSSKHPAAQLEYFLADSQCRMVITTEDFAAKVQPVASKLGVTMLTLAEADYSGTNIKEHLDTESLADSSVDDKLLQQKERHSKRLNRLQQLCDANKFKNKPALIFYTSGTTGSPKVSNLFYVVSTFMPRRSHISGARFTRSLLLASRLPAGRRSAPWDRAMAGLLLCVDSLLNRCYLLVSGSVRVRNGVVGRLGLGFSVKCYG